ncbi:MAG: response regulator [Bdellovibrionales bacterium]|nr:response regulator [Bdellovibrionales bacterium]
MGDVRDNDTQVALTWPSVHSAHSISQHSGLLLFAYSPRLQSLLSCSGDFESVLGTPITELSREANLFLRHTHPDDRFPLFNQLESALQGEEPYNALYRWIRPDTDRQVWLHCRAKLTKHNGEDVFEGFLLDISSQLPELPSSLACPVPLPSILHTIPAFLLVLDLDLRIAYVNRSPDEIPLFLPEKLLCRERMQQGTLLRDCLPQRAFRDSLLNTFRDLLTGKEQHYHHEFTDKDQVTSAHFLFEADPMLLHGAPCGLLVSVRSTEHLSKLQDELSELKKSEGFRRIASSLAHHLNNMLQAVLGHATAIRLHSDSPSRVRLSAGIIHELAESAAGLSQQLLALDTQSKQHGSFDLNLAIMQALNHFEELFSSTNNIAVHFVNLPPVVGNVEKLMGIVGQLLAFIHEHHQKDSNISITTSGEHALTHKEEGAWVSLTFECEIRDDLTRNTLEKSAEHLQKSIEDSFGRLRFTWKQTKSVTLTLSLPATTPTADTPQATAVRPVSPHGGPTILLIDDDSIVLETVKAILQEKGYRCLTAQEHTQALSIARKNKSQIDLVLLDALMPGMDGATLLKKLAPILKVPIIGFTGAPPGVTQSLRKAGAVELLKKPVAPQVLLEKIKKYLPKKEAKAVANS